MAKNNSSNQDYTNNSDGWDLSGGTTKRKLTVTGGDMTLTGSGANTYTFPASTDTLVGRASSDTLTNKTVLTTSNTLFPTPANDANGWDVYNYGVWKQYRKRVTFSQSVSTTATAITISSTNLPVGVSSIGTNFLDYSITATSFAGELQIVFEGNTGATTLNFTGSSVTARSYTGFIDVSLTTP